MLWQCGLTHKLPFNLNILFNNWFITVKCISTNRSVAYCWRQGCSFAQNVSWKCTILVRLHFEHVKISSTGGVDSFPWHRLTSTARSKCTFKIALVFFVVRMHLFGQIIIWGLLLNHVRKMRSGWNDWFAYVSTRRRHINFLCLISSVCLSLTGLCIDIHCIWVISLMVTISDCEIKIRMLLFTTNYIWGNFGR